MIDLNRLDLFDEKTKLLRAGTLSVVRTVALAVFVSGTLKSTLPVELKAVMIAGVVFAYVMLAALVEAATAVVSAQRAAMDVAHLSMISLEARRIAPEDTRGALQIQTEIEATERGTTEYRLQQGSYSDALSWHALQTAGTFVAIGAALAVVWYSWDPTLRWVATFARRLG